MDNYKQNLPLLLGGAATCLIGLTGLYMSRTSESECHGGLSGAHETQGFDNVIIGDVGGTNVRLQLIRLHHSKKDISKNETLKKLTIVKPGDVESFNDAILRFLKDVPASNYPRIGVVGIAGPVVNNRVTTVNIPHWPTSDGEAVKELCKLDSFTFINDFTAAGYGVTTLTDSEFKTLGSNNPRMQEGDRSVKVVIGPGTGLGQGVLIKMEEKGLYEIFPSEGGHADFKVKNDDDYELMEFARNFIETSNNVENLRAKGKIGRVSVERLCAGPAVPLIYAFMKKKHPDLEVILEGDGPDQKHFDQIVSKDVIRGAMELKDPLCLKVVEKFTENFGTETGNLALKTLPYGGIYLIGGVTTGIKDYLIQDTKFMDSFHNKGRHGNHMRLFPVMLINPEIEIGLRGAEEKARREMLKTIK